MKYPQLEGKVYPCSAVIIGTMTMEQYTEQLVDKFLDDFYYGYRFSPDSFIALVDAAKQRLEDIQRGNTK